MYQRLLLKSLSRQRPFCITGAKGVGKTSLLKDFAGQFSNNIYIDLQTGSDRSIFRPGASAEETIRAVSFLKSREIRGKGTLVVLDEIGFCPEAIRWVDRLVNGEANRQEGLQNDGSQSRQADGPLIVATSSFISEELELLINPQTGCMKQYFLFPFSFEEFLVAMNDPAALEAFREVPVPYYAYEKLLALFHLYALIGGMPEVTSEYAAHRHVPALKKIYQGTENGLIRILQGIISGTKSRELAITVLQNIYPYASTRISFKRFGNLEKGSREIGKAFHALELAMIIKLIKPVTTCSMLTVPDRNKFPRLQVLDAGLVNFFSGIQKPLFQSRDMNAIFEGQISRQIVGQEILATNHQDGRDGQPLNFWVRDKSQSTAEIDFVVPYNDLIVPVVVKSGEPGRLRSLHQFIDSAPHPYAVRLYAGKLGVQQARTIRGKQFYLLNLPYFLAGKIRDYLKGFIRFTGEK